MTYYRGNGLAGMGQGPVVRVVEAVPPLSPNANPQAGYWYDLETLGSTIYKIPYDFAANRYVDYVGGITPEDTSRGALVGYPFMVQGAFQEGDWRTGGRIYVAADPNVLLAFIGQGPKWTILDHPTTGNRVWVPIGTVVQGAGVVTPEPVVSVLPVAPIPEVPAPGPEPAIAPILVETPRPPAAVPVIRLPGGRTLPLPPPPEPTPGIPAVPPTEMGPLPAERPAAAAPARRAIPWLLIAGVGAVFLLGRRRAS